MMLFGALLFLGGAGLLAGAIASVRRRLRADARPSKPRPRPRPRIGRSALLAPTVPLQPVSAPALVLPRSRSGAPSSARGPATQDRAEQRRRAPVDRLSGSDAHPSRNRPPLADRPPHADRLPNTSRPPQVDRPLSAERPPNAGRP